LQCLTCSRSGIPLLIRDSGFFYAPFPIYHIGTVPPRGRLMAPLLRVSVRQRERLYLLYFYGHTNKFICMPYTETICLQANNSTLPATLSGAKSDSSTRNLIHSMDDTAARCFVLFLQSSFPDLRSIRFKKRGGKRCRFYILQVRIPGKILRVKGYSVQNTARNFMAGFNYNSFTGQ